MRAKAVSIGFEHLEGGGLTLRPWEPGDVVWVHGTCQDPEIQRWTKLPVPYRPSDAVALIRGSTDHRHSGTAASFAITVTDTGELLGAIGVKDIDRRARSAEIGYWLAPDARGRGVASGALRLVCRWCFDGLRVDTLHALVLVGNAPSERVLERGGFDRDRRPILCRANGVDTQATRFSLRRIQFDQRRPG